MLKALAIIALAALGSAPVAAQTQPAAAPLPDMALGSRDAPVEMIEYASMSCPHCAQFHTEILPAIKTKYIDTGKMRYVFREFPLNQPAFQASILARCAGPDRFFAFIDVLFREQAKWATGDVGAELKQIGRLGGVSPEKYDACLRDKPLVDGILQIAFIGQNEIKVNSTPSFVIGGKLYAGVQSVAEFEKIIEAALKGAPAPAAKSGPASQLSSSSGGVPPYIIVVVAVVIIGGVGIFLLRRRSSSKS